MSRALVVSLVLHLAIFTLVLFLVPNRGKLPVQVVSVHLSAQRAFSPEVSPVLSNGYSSEAGGQQRPSEPVPIDASAKPLPPLGTSPSPASAEPLPASPRSGSGSDDLIIDAMTSGAAFEKPELVGYPTPVYPRNARRQGWEGTVEVDVTVDRTGNETDMVVVHSSGHAALDEAALGALKQARYRPGSASGFPEAGTITVVMRFRLE